MDFPAERFQRAGATEREIEQLRESFDVLPESGQASYLERLAGTSDYDIAEGILHARGGEEGEAVEVPADQGAKASGGDTPGEIEAEVEVKPDAKGKPSASA